MLSLLRFTAGLLLVGLFTAGCFALQPAYFASLGLDVWEMPGLLCRLHDEDRRQETLFRQEERLRYSLKCKAATVIELSEGHLTLAEAVERFRWAAGDSLPLLCKQLHFLHPHAAPEELLHWHVIDWTMVVLEHQAELRFRVVARLQLELRAARPTLTGRSSL